MQFSAPPSSVAQHVARPRARVRPPCFARSGAAFDELSERRTRPLVPVASRNAIFIEAYAAGALQHILSVLRVRLDAEMGMGAHGCAPRHGHGRRRHQRSVHEDVLRVL
jgi:hypothetical protein